MDKAEAFKKAKRAHRIQENAIRKAWDACNAAVVEADQVRQKTIGKAIAVHRAAIKAIEESKEQNSGKRN